MYIKCHFSRYLFALSLDFCLYYLWLCYILSFTNWLKALCTNPYVHVQMHLCKWQIGRHRMRLVIPFKLCQYERKRRDGGRHGSPRQCPPCYWQACSSNSKDFTIDAQLEQQIQCGKSELVDIKHDLCFLERKGVAWYRKAILYSTPRTQI